MTSHQIPSAWSERGYVPPEQLNVNDDGDDKGEAAYMRCFHESSKIGRVPNASYFINSPTARAYLEKRDKELFPVKEASGKPIPNPDTPSWLSKKEGPKILHPAAPESVASSTCLQPLPLSETTDLSPSQEIRQQLLLPERIVPSVSTAMDQPNIPWSMEPQTGARGPSKMIR